MAGGLVSATVLTWNTQWATPSSHRTEHLLRRIDRHSPDVTCLTETHHDLLSRRGYSIYSRPDSGYGIKGGRRKVALWSRQSWHQVDDLGCDTLPPGRFVAGVTATPLGNVTVAGVCIPWPGSRIEPWRGDDRKKRWEDHGRYLDGLRLVLDRLPSERLIVIGDFNQRLDSTSKVPARLRRALVAALGPDMRIVTKDSAFEGRASIDHVALSADLAAGPVIEISNLHQDKRISDHFGVATKVGLGAGP